MVAPTAPIPGLSTRVTKLKALTPEAWRAFAVRFPAMLGPCLAETFRHSLAAQHFHPSDNKLKALHGHIFDHLVLALEDFDSLVVEMSAECGTDGPRAFHFLMVRLDPQSTATSIVSLIDLLTKPLDPEAVPASIRAKIALNAKLPTDLKLPPQVMSVLTLIQLPDQFTQLRDIVIERDSVPSVTDLVTKVENMHTMQSAASSAPRPPGTIMLSAGGTYADAAKKKQCVNCDATSHFTYQCKATRSECNECGPNAGHLPKYCLVQSDQPFPRSMAPEKVTELQAKRDAYKARNATQVNMLVCKPAVADDDEDFWSRLGQGKQSSAAPTAEKPYIPTGQLPFVRRP